LEEQLAVGKESKKAYKAELRGLKTRLSESDKIIDELKKRLARVEKPDDGQIEPEFPTPGGEEKPDFRMIEPEKPTPGGEV